MKQRKDELEEIRGSYIINKAIEKGKLDERRRILEIIEEYKFKDEWNMFCVRVDEFIKQIQQGDKQKDI